MELQEKIMNVIYDSGYEPVVGNHKRGHVDMGKLTENMVILFGVHYGDVYSACDRMVSSLKNDHALEKERIYMVVDGHRDELARLRSRNWYQRLFNL